MEEKKEGRTEINSMALPGSLKELSLVFAVGQTTHFSLLLIIFIN